MKFPFQHGPDPEQLVHGQQPCSTALLTAEDRDEWIPR
jgi:hypothetical protein